MKSLINSLIIFVLFTCIATTKSQTSSVLHSPPNNKKVETMKQPNQCKNEEAIGRIRATPVGDSFSFTIIGDTAPYASQEYDSVFSGLMAQMEQLEPKPAFMAALGDFAGGGSAQQYDHYQTLVSKLSIPNITAIGNHDRDDLSGWQTYRNIRGPLNYEFAFGNTRFIVLKCHWGNRINPNEKQTQDIDGLTETELEFLEDCLQRNTHEVKVIMMHSPPSFNNRFAGRIGDGFPDLESDFLALVDKYDVNLVLAAHVICYDRYEYNGTTFVTSAGGGYELDGEFENPPYDGHFHHFVEITIDQSTGAFTGRVIKHGDGTTSLSGFSF